MTNSGNEVRGYWIVPQLTNQRLRPYCGRTRLTRATIKLVRFVTIMPWTMELLKPKRHILVIVYINRLLKAEAFFSRLNGHVLRHYH